MRVGAGLIFLALVGVFGEENVGSDHAGVEHGRAEKHDTESVRVDRSAAPEEPEVAEKSSKDQSQAAPADDQKRSGLRNSGLSAPGARLVPANEVLLPYRVPGPQIQCSKEGEMYLYMSTTYDCYVCACLSNLLPVCGSCGACGMKPPKPVPPPVPTPSPVYPVPVPPGRASCSPLPSNKPYDNPLNPCQSCLCTEMPSRSQFGKLEVQINCYDNGRCVLPSDKKISPTPKPPFDPVPLPPKSKLNPLPGPSPHSSCHPFRPRVPFSHPRDECQICECAEVLAFGVINVEVYCYTNPACCLIELPSPGVGPQLGLPLSGYYACAGREAADPAGPGGSLGHSPVNSNSGLSPGYLPGLKPGYPSARAPGSSYLDANGNANSLNENYLPQALQYPGAGPLSGPSSNPNGGGYTVYRPGVTSASSLAEALANSQVGSSSASANAQGGLSPGGYLPYGQGAGSTASALAEAVANAQGGLSPGYQPYNQGSSASALTEALANNQGGLNSPGYAPYNQGGSSASALAEALANNQGGYSPYNQGGSSASSLAESLANNQGGYSPYNQGGSSASSLAEALANNQGGYSPYNQGGSSASSLAEALANNQGGYSPHNQGGSSAALANAFANAQGLGSGGYNPYNLGGSPASSLAEAVANTQAGVSPSYYPYGSGGASSSAQAEALANAYKVANGLPGAYQGGLSNAKANALSQSYQPNGYLPSSELASAEASAIANAESAKYQPYGGYPGYSSASANALVESSSGGLYPGLGGQSQALASADAGLGGSAQATAESSSFGGSSQAGAQAKAQSYLTKSGDDLQE